MSVVVDRVGFRCSDLAAGRALYEAALAELGFTVLSEGTFGDDRYVPLGRDQSVFFTPKV